MKFFGEIVYRNSYSESNRLILKGWSKSRKGHESMSFCDLFVDHPEILSGEIVS